MKLQEVGSLALLLQELGELRILRNRCRQLDLTFLTSNGNLADFDEKYSGLMREAIENAAHAHDETIEDMIYKTLRSMESLGVEVQDEVEYQKAEAREEQ